MAKKNNTKKEQIKLPEKKTKLAVSFLLFYSVYFLPSSFILSRHHTATNHEINAIDPGNCFK